MPPYLGAMPTSLLADSKIRPTEYRKWAEARHYFDHRDKDRRKVEELRASITQHGIREPLILGISARFPDDVYVADGHHRAVAIMDMGLSTFPFHWYWIRSFGVEMERDPFPYDTLT
jgi:ParB-like chromosome segregation protein Spo0J